MSTPNLNNGQNNIILASCSLRIGCNLERNTMASYLHFPILSLFPSPRGIFHLFPLISFLFLSSLPFRPLSSFDLSSSTSMFILFSFSSSFHSTFFFPPPYLFSPALCFSPLSFHFVSLPSFFCYPSLIFHALPLSFLPCHPIPLPFPSFFLYYPLSPFLVFFSPFLSMECTWWG